MFCSSFIREPIFRAKICTAKKSNVNQLKSHNSFFLSRWYDNIVNSSKKWINSGNNFSSYIMHVNPANIMIKISVWYTRLVIRSKLTSRSSEETVSIEVPCHLIPSLLKTVKGYSVGAVLWVLTLNAVE